MSGWGNSHWGLNTLVHSFSAGVGGGLGAGLGHAASAAVVHSVQEHMHKPSHSASTPAPHSMPVAPTPASPVAPAAKAAPAPTLIVPPATPTTPHVVGPQQGFGAPPLGPMQGKLTPEQQTYFTAPTMPACAPPARPPPSLFTHANVLRAFDAHTAAECTVREGEVVEVLHPDPSGWTEVRAPDGRRGWVPSTYLSPAF